MKNPDNLYDSIEKIRFIREKALKNKRPYSELKLNKPISFWIKDDRLLNEIGKEFTVILRTRGCRWALGRSGGCTMCGYIQDCAIEGIKSDQIKNQFKFAIEARLDELSSSKDKFILKIFNSGSFFDDSEIDSPTREYIYEKINGLSNVEELVVESRVEFLTKEKLTNLKEMLGKKYVEIAIGLETVNDHYRNEYINKGLLYEDFLKAFELCKEIGLGTRIYLLFKPPFMSEQSAIDDCVHSIKTLIELGVNTISINPVNIQKGSYLEYLFYQNRYRPPWFYSLFKALILALNRHKSKPSVRILSDPSGAGTKRGIHNCLRKDCNERMEHYLRRFVLSQDVKNLEDIIDIEPCDCLTEYRFKKQFV